MGLPPCGGNGSFIDPLGLADNPCTHRSTWRVGNAISRDRTLGGLRLDLGRVETFRSFVDAIPRGQGMETRGFWIRDVRSFRFRRFPFLQCASFHHLKEVRSLSRMIRKTAPRRTRPGKRGINAWRRLHRVRERVRVRARARDFRKTALPQMSRDRKAQNPPSFRPFRRTSRGSPASRGWPPRSPPSPCRRAWRGRCR